MPAQVAALTLVVYFTLLVLVIRVLFGNRALKREQKEQAGRLLHSQI
jgi:hypothetical protein